MKAGIEDAISRLQEAEEMWYVGAMSNAEFAEITTDTLVEVLGPDLLMEMCDLIESGKLVDMDACNWIGSFITDLTLGPSHPVPGRTKEEELRDPSFWFASFLIGHLAALAGVDDDE